MRLYPRAGQTALAHAGQTYTAGGDGGFDLPEYVALEVHAFHANGKPLWETDIERQHRLIAEEAERRKDPATLLDAVNQLVAAAQATVPPPPAAPPKTPRARSKSTPAAA